MRVLLRLWCGDGLLIDICERYGIDAIAQVDLLERIHHNQSLEALGKMSFAIIQAVMRKLERHYERDFIAEVNKTMKLVRYENSGYFLDVQEIADASGRRCATCPNTTRPLQRKGRQ